MIYLISPLSMPAMVSTMTSGDAPALLHLHRGAAAATERRLEAATAVHTQHLFVSFLRSCYAVPITVAPRF
jgi:hypothetical protein